jgi:hypothetical protein
VTSEPKLPEEERGILAGIEFAYGKVLPALNLNPDESRTLLAMLVRRAEAGKVAREVAIEKGADPRDLPALVSISRADAEKEINERFGEERYTRIKATLEATSQLLTIATDYEPALTQQKVGTLDARQTLHLR